MCIRDRHELVALMGAEGYAELKKFCDARMEAIAATAKESKKRELPLSIIHPATIGAQK